jgi:hypothetical protein
MSSKASMKPSRAIVARTCSEPGVMVKADLALRPCEAASRAIEADRDMSSYDELVHEPMRPTLSSEGHECFLTSAANLEMGVARSGVKGPLMWGSSSLRFYPMSARPLPRFSEQVRATHNLDALVVLAVLVGLEVVVELLGVAGLGGTAGSLEVLGHAVVEGEERSGRTDLGTHVTDGGHTRARVLDDGAGTALDGEDASDLEDDV